ESGKAVGCTDGKDRGYGNTQVDGVTHERNIRTAQIGRIGNICRRNAEGDTVCQRVELFSDGAAHTKPAGYLPVESVEQCCKENQERGHKVALGGVEAREDHRYESA